MPPHVRTVTTMALATRLRDGMTRAGPCVTCQVESGGGLGIAIEGYGTASVIAGPVIYLEHTEASGLRLYVWADATTDDPSAVIDLEGARETSPPS